MPPDASLYLFDGYNLLHAGGFGERRELVDALASFVATKGARGIVVFDGEGDEGQVGPLEVRFAAHADTVLERLAAEHRSRERVLLVSSDTHVVEVAGREVARLTSPTFLAELAPHSPSSEAPGGLGDKLDEETRDRLERLRRGK